MSRETQLIERLTRTRVVAGILRNTDGRILITDRSRARSMREFWEFPGGKIENGECADAALGRELAEELGIGGLEFEHFRTLNHDYPDIRVSIDFFIVSAWQGVPVGMEGQQLRWVDANELNAALLLPADAPIVAALVELREKR